MTKPDDLGPTPIKGDYEASPTDWVRAQVEQIEAAGDTTQVQHPLGLQVVLLTMRGAKSGKVRKVPLMRVEHDGAYLAVASKGGAPDHPQWYYNLVADPDLDLMDGRVNRPFRAHLAEGPERALWWERAVAAFPPYADYAERTERQIPVFVLEPRDDGSARARSNQ